MHSQLLEKWLLKTREDETQAPSFYNDLVIAAIKYLATFQLQQLQLQSHLSRTEKYRASRCQLSFNLKYFSISSPEGHFDLQGR